MKGMTIIMRRRKKAVAVLCLVLIMCFECSVFVFCQNEDRGADITQPEQKWAERALLQEWETHGAAVYEQSFSGDHRLTGLFSQCTEYFNIGDWEIHDAVLVLAFSTTQLLEPEVSDLTVSINDVPVYSQRVIPTEGAFGQVIIPLPSWAVKTDAVNSIKLEVYLRGEAVDVCTDDLSGSKWMNVFQESRILVSYTPVDDCQSIARFYSRFCSIDALQSRQSALCVQTGATPSTLTAAALTLSGVAGKAVLGYQNIALRQLANTAELSAYRYVVYISAYDTLADVVSALLTDEDKQAASKGTLIALKQLDDSYVLLITGSNEQGLIDAGRMLANPDYVAQLDTETKILDKQTDFVVHAQSPQQYLPLTQYGVELKGSFRQSTDFHIEYPANRTIAPSSELSLDIRYSDNLVFERSLVTVYIDNIPIGSKQLSPDGAKGETVVFSFPEDLMLTGGFSVKVAFDLDVGEEWCRLTPEQMPWGYVADTSMLKINSSDQATLVFGNYPSPFLRDGSMNNTVIILPNTYGAADLEALGLLALAFGRFLKDNAGNLTVAFAADTVDLSQANIISIGRMKHNTIAQQLEQQLYFRFDEAQNTLLSNEKMSIDPEYGRSLGIAQLIYSPYSEQPHALLLITGVTDDGMLRAARYLGDTDMLWKLSGDGYAASDDEVFCYTFSQNTEGAQPQGLKEETPLQTVQVFGAVVVAVLALCLLAVIMLLTKYARRNRS